MRCIVIDLKQMIDCRDVNEGTVAWERTNELLQIAQQAYEEGRGGRTVRGRRSCSST